MTNEEKNLLLKDLCARLPYGLFVEENREKLDQGPVIYTYDYHPCITDCKPYLRPMSSMTEEEKKKVHYFVESHKLGNCSRSGVISDYLNSIHIDYRGLIEKGLALEAPEGMYNLKNK